MVTIEQLQEIVYQNAIGIAELREAQKKTDEQLKELKERMDQTDKQIKATEEQLKKTDEQLKKTDEQLKKTDEQLKKTDEQMNKTDARLNKIAKLVGNMSNNQGEVAEEYFVNSLKYVLKISRIFLKSFTTKLLKETFNTASTKIPPAKTIKA